MIKLQLPLKKEDIAQLRAGDEVLLTGPVYTGRDAAHKRLTEAMARGEELPVAVNLCCHAYRHSSVTL